jgi:hypothetical protein
MYLRARSLRKPFAWALTFGLGVGVVGCGGSPPVPDSAPKPEAKQAGDSSNTTSKGGKKQFAPEEPTAAEKRAARIKAAQGK